MKKKETVVYEHRNIIFEMFSFYFINYSVLKYKIEYSCRCHLNS